MSRLLRISLAAVLAAGLTAVGAETPKSGAAASDASKSPQATAYLAWVKAVKGKDVEAWKKVVPAEAVKQLDAQAKEMGKKPVDVIEFLGMMTPDENKISGLKVDGSKATLSVVGKTKGEAGTSYGTVELVLEGGSWKVGKQSWETKSK